jgi:invasion protein IalB
MIRTAIYPVLMMALCTLCTQTVHAQAKPGEVDKLISQKTSRETIGAWAVQCSEVKGEKKLCNLAQTLVQAKTKRSIASWVISKDKNGKVMAAVTIPAGVSVPAGLTVVIGKQAAQKLQYSTCLKSSCISQFELTSANLQEMSGGEKAVFTAETLANKKINIQFPLKGFSEAFKAYQGEIG